MEALMGLTLFGSWIWFWVSIAVFIIICFVSDVNENGFLAFATLILLAVGYYFKGQIDPLLQVLTLQNILIYLGVGLGFSILRTFFAGRTLGHRINEQVKEWQESKLSEKTIEEKKEYSKKAFLDDLKGNVFRWWFMWPISMITWAVTDIVKDVYDFIYSRMKGFYNSIVELGMKTVK